MTNSTISTISDREPDLHIAALTAQYAQRALTPSALIALLLKRIELVDRPEVWISRVEDEVILERARELERLFALEGEAIVQRLPLFGIPFAVKDNIDVAGMATTAACPEFAYEPETSAFVVDKLLEAGAILLGKTNLDQFATGLVGTRSPFGKVRNSLHPERISGGSSSGSAVAVALDLVSFTLGTDTAGSGRVPAGLNNIVGLKPTRGLLSTRGVFPACRSLDCVSVFAKSISDAWYVTQMTAGFDASDAYARKIAMLPVKTKGYRIAVPHNPDFFGDLQAQQAFQDVLANLKGQSNIEISEIDFTPFKDAAALLYQGPWVAERLAAVGEFFDTNYAAIDPVVAGIIGQGKNFSAVDTFKAQYRLADLKRQAESILADYDFMITPTAPTFPRIADIQANPVIRNSELGCYTNFVNFFDMAALAVPATHRADGLPFGITLIGASGSDHLLADAAQKLLSSKDVSVATTPLPFVEPVIQIAVVGAHLSGQPLNWQLQECSARLVCAASTADQYKLYALSGTVPPKPGLERVTQDGKAIALEVWEMPSKNFGKFIQYVPHPLVIGTIELADGAWVKGFLCEPLALQQAKDISSFGGWLAYLNATAH